MSLGKSQPWEVHSLWRLSSWRSCRLSSVQCAKPPHGHQCTLVGDWTMRSDSINFHRLREETLANTVTLEWLSSTVRLRLSCCLLPLLAAPVTRKFLSLLLGTIVYFGSYEAPCFSTSLQKSSIPFQLPIFFKVVQLRFPFSLFTALKPGNIWGRRFLCFVVLFRIWGENYCGHHGHLPTSNAPPPRQSKLGKQLPKCRRPHPPPPAKNMIVSYLCLIITGVLPVMNMVEDMG